MTKNYLLIASGGFLGASQWDIFIPAAGDENDYYCAQKTDVIIDQVTLDAYPGTFEKIENLTQSQKLAAWSRKYHKNIGWSPAIDDYFATEKDDLALYKIVDKNPRFDEWGYILLSGGALFSSVKWEGKNNFSQGRLHITAFDEVDDSSSASASGSGSGS